jgi:RNA polymerase sigma-70 factor, ECF subfamily
MTFRDVYEAHFDFVWRSLRRLGVREADAADLLQEVFLVVLKRLSEFRGQAKMTTWLFRISMNVARARQKLAHVRREVVDSEVVEQQTSEGGDPSAAAENREGLALLEHALSRMDIDQRAAFVLFELEELSCPEIAEALEIPLGTVYSRLRLGREAFHKALARGGP